MIRITRCAKQKDRFKKTKVARILRLAGAGWFLAAYVGYGGRSGWLTVAWRELLASQTPCAMVLEKQASGRQR